MTLTKSISILFVPLLLLGCKKGGSSDNYVPKKKPALASAMLAPGEEMAYMPLAVGNQWTYTIESKRQVGSRVMANPPTEITYKVAKVSPEPKGKYAILEVFADDKLADKQVWHVDKSGIYQVAIGKNLAKFSSPQPVMKFPVKTGESFKWSGTGTVSTGLVGKSEINSILVGEQPIDAAMGTFNAVSVSSTGKIATAKAKATTTANTWFIPKVGLARYMQQVEGTLEDGKTKFAQLIQLRLKSYSLKN